MTISDLLNHSKTIAVVGLSDKPDRPSYQVATYLRDHGYTIIPVNPMIQSFLGTPAYKSILDIPRTIHIDIVDIFRKSEEVPQIVCEIINSGRAPFIWMQEGVVSPEARELAEAHSLEVTMNTCLMKTHKKLSEDGSNEAR